MTVNILKSLIQEYQPLVLIQSLLCILFNFFPGCKHKIWKFLTFFFFSVWLATTDISDGLTTASDNLRDVSSHWKIWNSEQKICIWHMQAHATMWTTEKEQTPPQTVLMTWRNSQTIIEKTSMFHFKKWNFIMSTNICRWEVTSMQGSVPMRGCKVLPLPLRTAILLLLLLLFYFPFGVSNNVSNARMLS